jgi:hypothetical protein
LIGYERLNEVIEDGEGLDKGDLRLISIIMRIELFRIMTQVWCFNME